MFVKSLTLALLALGASAQGVDPGYIDMTLACRNQYGKDYYATIPPGSSNHDSWICIHSEEIWKALQLQPYCDKYFYGTEAKHGEGKNEWNCVWNY